MQLTVESVAAKPKTKSGKQRESTVPHNCARNGTEKGHGGMNCEKNNNNGLINSPQFALFYCKICILWLVEICCSHGCAVALISASMRSITVSVLP